MLLDALNGPLVAFNYCYNVSTEARPVKPRVCLSSCSGKESGLPVYVFVNKTFAFKSTVLTYYGNKVISKCMHVYPFY